MMDSDQLAAWLASRAGKLTASRMRDALAVLKNGQPAKARADLIRDLLAERLTGASIRHYVTPAMQFGLDYEDEAKSAYEAHTGDFIVACGFYDHPTIDNFGASPDGLLGSDGLIEIKVPNSGTWVEYVMGGVVPEEHKPQMLAQMACTGRRWCEFVAFDPRVKKRSPLFIRRFEPGPEDVARIEASAELFLREVDAAWEQLTTAAA
jgi:hypothetical protein